MTKELLKLKVLNCCLVGWLGLMLWMQECCFRFVDDMAGPRGDLSSTSHRPYGVVGTAAAPLTDRFACHLCCYYMVSATEQHFTAIPGE